MAEKPTYEELERRPKEVATEAVERNRTERGQGESEESFLAKKPVAFIAGILILFGLYLSSLYNYLLFHSLAEIFSIVVACGIFIVAWNSRRILDNNYLLFLGIAFLFIGALDLVHTLGYTGMGIFQGYGTNLPAQLWIATRYMESLSLLIAPLFLARRLRTDFVLMIYAVVTVLVLGSVFYWHIFPTCFVEGEGLTPFKKISEYIISIILIGAITVLFQKRKEFDERVFRLLVASIALTIASELAFTFYIHAYGFSNLVGHYFKLISFYLIYKAIIETGLVRPYDLLFRNLKKSEESLRLQGEISSNLSEGVYLVRVGDGVILYTNPIFEEIFGYGPGEMVGKHASIVNAPTEMTPEERVDHIVGIMKKTGSWRDEIQNIKKNGTPFWCYASASIFDHPEYGEIIISVHTDISDRKQVEKKLQETQKELDIIFNSVPALVWSKNNEGKYIQVNRAYCETVGLPEEQIIGRTDYDLYPADIADQYSKYDQEVINSKKPVLGIEERHLKSSGDYGWSLTEKSPYYDAESNIVGTIGFAIDITDMKQAEETLRKSEEKYRSLVESTEDSIYLVDRDGTYLFANEKHLSRLGSPMEKVIGRTYSEFHSLDDTKEFVGKLEDVFETGQAIQQEHRSSRDDRYFLRTLTRIQGPDGNTTSITVVSKDITEFKEAEENLRQANEELSREQNQRKILSMRLIDLLEKDRRQIAMELHDHIGQILTSLKMDIEMIHGKLKPEHRELGARITAAQERTIQAIKDVKNISRGLRPGMLDALGLVPSLRELFSEIQRQTDIEIQFFNRNIPKRIAPEKELAIYRIAQEALTNIIRHAQAKNVFVNLVKKDEKLSLSAEDDGVGFNQDKVMTLSKKKGPLGLLIMRERAEQLDGDFTLESQIGKGTHLLVEIPL